ncbi:MAG TPA: trypsin-like serine protease [Kofleriaceae bacterium]|nr:trypsin-like serine protease [Kofleriaceae bacterium]
MRRSAPIRAITYLVILGGLALARPASADPDVVLGPAPQPVSILGGTATTVEQYPTVVGLVIGNNLCTGTLISPTWVLTAAHCVDPKVLGLASQDEVTRSVQVHFHTVDINQDAGTVVDASATFKHPGFDQAHLGMHDIGLIQLATSVTDIVPSPINLDAATAPVGTRVTLVGYGKTMSSAQGGGIEFELKNRTSVSCPSLGIGDDANLLCFSQADSKGTCSGDSGGPSFASIYGKTVVVAVTSFGDQQCSQFGANTRVDVEQAFLAMYIPDVVGCLTDADCPTHRSCFAHRCIADPFSPNGIGTVCNTAADCDSQECAESSQDGKRCSFTCNVSDTSACPDGFECLRAMGDLGACWPAEQGLCNAGGAHGPATMLLGLGVALAALRRKRA